MPNILYIQLWRVFPSKLKAFECFSCSSKSFRKLFEFQWEFQQAPDSFFAIVSSNFTHLELFRKYTVCYSITVDDGKVESFANRQSSLRPSYGSLNFNFRRNTSAVGVSPLYSSEKINHSIISDAYQIAVQLSFVQKFLFPQYRYQLADVFCNFCCCLEQHWLKMSIQSRKTISKPESTLKIAKIQSV